MGKILYSQSDFWLCLRGVPAIQNKNALRVAVARTVSDCEVRCLHYSFLMLITIFTHTKYFVIFFIGWYCVGNAVEDQNECAALSR